MKGATACNVEKELAGEKGIFKAKQRKELQEQAEQTRGTDRQYEQYLSSIVQVVAIRM